MNLPILFKLHPLLLLFLFSLLFTHCGKDEIPKSDLVIKDNLFYKKGNDAPFTGREKVRVENKIMEYDIKDGIKHGEFRLYSENGNLEIKGQLDSNRNVGKWQYFYPGGEIESEGYFVNNLSDGKWVWYYPEGEKREEGSYQKGQRVGLWYQFNNNGEVVFKKNFDLEDTLNTAEDSIRTEI